MGWREINMNRRKPRRDVAVAPMAAGESRDAAVLRKAVAAALAAVEQQRAEGGRFAAGYLAGFARREAQRHGLDAEADGGAALLTELGAQAPDGLKDAVQALQLGPRRVPSSRAALAAADAQADAGYLVGHLESLCGTRRLLATGGDVEAYLTLCDHAADRLQTHQPTEALRFDPAERAAVRAALVRL